MSREETIQLMDLLTLYIDDCEKEQKRYGECETKQELAKQIMISNHIMVAGQIKEVLCFNL